jgi:hypothetical protein
MDKFYHESPVIKRSQLNDNRKITCKDWLLFSKCKTTNAAEAMLFTPSNFARYNNQRIAVLIEIR